MTKVTQEMIDYLYYLADGGEPRDRQRGICNNFGRLFESWHFLEDFDPWEHYESWHKFSHDNVYPVPSPWSDYLGAAGVEYRSCQDKWSNDQYGDDRRELCCHIANCMRNVLRNQTQSC